MTFIKGHKINLGRKRPDMVKNQYRIGVSPWNKGLTKEDPRVLRYSQAKIGVARKDLIGNKFCLGKHMSEENKSKMSTRIKGKKYRLGIKPSSKAIELSRIRFTGPNNPNWKGGITSKERIERVKFQNEMQKLVFERDNYTCQMCEVRGVSLQVDHIQPWSEYVELRFSMDNCRTLCMKCHYQITFNKPMPPNIKTWGHNYKERILG